MPFCGSDGLLLNPWQGGVWLNWLKYQSLRDSLSETSSSLEILVSPVSTHWFP